MREQQPITQTINATDIRARWSTVVNQVARKQTRILVEKSGVPVAAIVSADDLVQLHVLEEQRAERRRILATMRERFADRTEEQIAAEVARVVAQEREASHQAPTTSATG